jgi:hypothetical protein
MAGKKKAASISAPDEIEIEIYLIQNNPTSVARALGPGSAVSARFPV